MGVRRLPLVVLLALAACDGALTPVPLPDSAGSRFEELRSWEVGFGADGKPLREWVAAEGGRLPEDLLSLTLMASCEEDSVPLVFDVRDGNGRALVDPARSEWSLNRALGGRRLALAFLPSSSALGSLGPNLQVGVQFREPPLSTTPPSVMVTAYVKRPAQDRGGVPDTQELPVVLVLVGEGPQEDEALAQAFHEVQEIWATAGIAVRRYGTVRLSGAVYRIFERLTLEQSLGSDSGSLGSLLSLSGQVETTVERPLFIFVLPQIVIAGPGLGIWAVSGGIPVAPVPGTPRSGVAVSAEAVANDPVFAGQIMAHEIGHALGLYHTTEGRWASQEEGGVVGPVHDQLDDTPDCPAEADSRRADQLLAPDECGAHDAGNLMFWVGTRGARGLTPEQASVARRSALTR